MSTIVADEPELADEPAADTDPVIGESGPRWAQVAAFVSVGAVLAAIVVAVQRAVSEGWVPIGDNAYFALRSRDVLTAHHPLLGTWTSASLSLGVDVNNPGPLLFDLLALPAKIDGDIGLALGVAALNGLCVIGIAVFAWRLGGPALVTLAMVPAAGLAWAMGSELLFDPWQPHSLLFPFLFGLTLTWAAAAGDMAALPWLLGVGSLLVQTHLSYAYIVPALWLCGGVGVVLAARSRRGRRFRLGRWAAASAVVLVLCWSQPVVEQLTSDGEGNISRLVDAMGEGEGIGSELGGRLVAGVVTLPPWWSRSGFADTFVQEPVRTIPGTRPAVAGIPPASSANRGFLVLAVLLVAGAVLARRRRDPVAGGAVAVSFTAVLAGLITASSIPLGVLGIAPHQLRWLWPIGLFVTLTLGLCLLRAVPAAIQVGVGCAAVLLLVVLALPRAPAVAGPSLDADAIAVVRELDSQLGVLEGRGPVLFDPGITRFAEPYTAPVMAELQRRGIEFRVTDEGAVRQLGPSRRIAGGERLLVTLREGSDALEDVPAAERVALASSLTESDRRELDGLAPRARRIVSDHGVTLTDLGRRAEAVGALDLPADADGTYRNPVAMIDFGFLVDLLDLGIVAPRPEDAELLERWADLRYRLERETVGVFVIPLPGARDDG